MLRRFRVKIHRRFYLVAVLMGFSLLSGLATRDPLSYRLFYILVLTVCFSYLWNLLSIKSIRLIISNRTAQARVGDNIKEDLTIESSSWLPKLSMEIRDETDLPGYSGGAVISLDGNISGYSKSNYGWTMKTLARKRGLYRLGPVRVSSTDPFGMFSQEKFFGEESTVIVYPKLVQLSGFDLFAYQFSGDGRLRRRTHNVTPHASAVREYAFGDSLSRIHWNSTARMGKLMSKDFDLGRSGELWVIIDMEHEVQAGELDESTDEYSVTLGASLAKMYLEEATVPVGLIAYGNKRFFIEAEPGVGQFNRILDYLAMSKAEGNTPIETVLATEEPLWDSRSALIVLTSSPRKDWVFALGELIGRGVKTSVILMDTQSFGGQYDTGSNFEHLHSSGIPAYKIRSGDDLVATLNKGIRNVRDLSRQNLTSVGSAE